MWQLETLFVMLSRTKFTRTYGEVKCETVHTANRKSEELVRRMGESQGTSRGLGSKKLGNTHTLIHSHSLGR